MSLLSVVADCSRSSAGNAKIAGMAETANLTGLKYNFVSDSTRFSIAFSLMRLGNPNVV